MISMPPNEVPDSNRGVSQGEVAPHHESAPTRAHMGSAGGVSAHPAPADAYWLDIAAKAAWRERIAILYNRPEMAAEYAADANKANGLACQLAGCMDCPMPSEGALYEFIRDEYLHSRLEGRDSIWPNGVPGGGTYSNYVMRRHYEDLQQTGMGTISHYESRRGKVVYYDRTLKIINPDAPHVEIRRRAPGDWS